MTKEEETETRIQIDLLRKAGIRSVLHAPCPICSESFGFAVKTYKWTGEIISQETWLKLTCRKCKNSFMLDDDLHYWSIPVCETCGQEMQLIDDTNVNRITWKCTRDNKLGYGKLVHATCQIHNVDKNYDEERNEYFCSECDPGRHARLERSREAKWRRMEEE